MRSSGHTSETKACVQSATSLNVAVGSSSVPGLLAQRCGREGQHTPLRYFTLSEKITQAKMELQVQFWPADL